MTPISARLRHFADYKCFRSIRAFEQKAGLPNSFVASAKKITMGRQKQLSDAFPDLNIEWLLTGEGEMLLDEQGKEVLKWPKYMANVQSNINSPNSVQFANGGNAVYKSREQTENPASESIPLIPTEMSRASNVDIYDRYKHEEMLFSEHLPAFPKFADIDFYVQVTDESMSPEFRSGDYLAIRVMDRDEPIINGNVYILDLRKSGFLFRVLKDRDESIECIALGNRERYENIRVNKSEVYRVYDVKGMFRICR